MSSYHFTSADFAHQPLGLSPDCPPPAEPVPLARLNSQSDWALLGESTAVRRLRSQILRVAPYYRTALIRGEQGAGKEVVARAIHALSSVADMPFVVADACAFEDSLDRSPTSYPQPAFALRSGSSAAEVLESARGGTVYITQVGELSLSHQANLSRFLQAFEEGRNGALHPARGRMQPRGISNDLAHPRILASSSRDLRTLATVGQFRKDLYARLSVLEIFVPPLRERIDDLPNLVDSLLGQLAEESGHSSSSFAESAMLQLQQHPWPNNLRELKRVITQATALTQGGEIQACHLLALVEPQAAPSTGIQSQRLHDVVQRHVLDVLLRCEGNKVRTAELLGISRSTLYRMLEARVASDVRLVE